MLRGSFKSVCQSPLLPVGLSVCPSVCMSVCMSVCLITPKRTTYHSCALQRRGTSALALPLLAISHHDFRHNNGLDGNGLLLRRRVVLISYVATQTVLHYIVKDKSLQLPNPKIYSENDVVRVNETQQWVL